MRKYFLVVLMLAVTLMISGQQGCDRTSSEDVGEGPYVGGNDGLEIAFLDDAPPLSGNFQGDSIPLELELTNHGETEIAAGVAVINLIGTVMGGAFDLSDSDGQAANVGIIDRIRDSGDVSDSDFVNLGTAILKDSEPIGPSWSPNLRAQVCYPYSTSLQVDTLCIPGARSEAGTVECEVDSAENLLEKGDVSGAPITVTSLVEGRTGTGIRVTLDIENVGGGTVVTTACTNSVNVPLGSRDLVTVDVPSGYSCLFSDGQSGTSGTVKLRSNKGRLRCTNAIGGNGRSYTDRFTATLTYNYVEETGKTILIQSQTANL
jgi:hypothetical protein